MAIVALDEMPEWVGRSSTSDWITVDQAMIDRFADATGDRQFIHVDPAAAAATPFGGTIAHGFLTLSLMPMMAETADLPRPAGTVMAVNYGCDGLRCLTPVRSGSRVRGRFTLRSFDLHQPGRYRQVMGFAVDIDGVDRPALVADWITLIVL